MASVFRKTATKPLPANAEIIIRKGERLARWKDSRGKNRTAAVTTGRDGTDRIVIQAGTFTAKYRDGQGIVREFATGCRTKDGALSVLRELTSRAEKVKAKILTPEEDRIADHQATPLENHIAGYIDHQTAKDVHPARIENTRSRLRRVAVDCGFARLADVSGSALERWLLDRQREGMSAGARNGYREAWIGFANWCVKTSRLLSNSLSNVPKADAKADRDLKFAGIPKEDDRGWTVDVHALRHTFGTHLSKAGVAPRVAQAAMRHSSIDLTMNVYTDPRLLDVHGALDSLPALSLDGSTADTQAEAKATGTDNATARQFAPESAPKPDNWCKPLSIVGNSDDSPSDAKNDVNPEKTSVSQGLPKSGRLDLNKRPLRPESDSPERYAACRKAQIRRVIRGKHGFLARRRTYHFGHLSARQRQESVSETGQIVSASCDPM